MRLPIRVGSSPAKGLRSREPSRSLLRMVYWGWFDGAGSMGLVRRSQAVYSLIIASSTKEAREKCPEKSPNQTPSSGKSLPKRSGPTNASVMSKSARAIFPSLSGRAAWSGT
jgi:hypothetical protein